MPRHPDWNPLLGNLEQLHKLWVKKAEAAGDDKAWIRGVLFGIEVGWNRIAEEVAKPNPSIGAIMKDWQRHLNSREGAVEGVDYGIELVIECVRRFFMSMIPRESTRPASPTTANGDETEEVS